ncbi:MAG: PQQ-binding-like beta-propeller repeat protein [Alphaproteobacteria bacterium]|nr:PQQ-binding-like beta-propeller repeat protein [Alphaproteobacteria bacterium]
MQGRLVSAFGIVLCLALAGCGYMGAKKGTALKGTRVSIMEEAKGLEADKDLQGEKPQVPGMVDNAGWPQAGYDTAHLMPNAILGENLQEEWMANVGSGSSSSFALLARPVVSHGRVFTMDSHGVVKAFDNKTGDRLWYFETTPEDRDDDAIGGGIGVDGDTVYATTGFGEVLALQAETGNLKWRRALLNPLRAAPTISDGRVYAVSIDNQLSALDTRTGDVLWHHNGISESATLMGASSPAVSGDSVVVTYSSGEVYNLRAENGRVSWSYALTMPTQVGALPAIADIRGLPVIGHGRTFVVSHSGRMASIDHRTGDRDWEVDIGGLNTPLVAGDAVFILSNDGQLVALSRTSGRIMWVKELQKLTDPDDRGSTPVFWSGPVLGGSRLWLTNSLGQLMAYSPDDGREVETIEIDEPIYMPPVIADKVLYVVTDNGDLIALR